MVEELAAIKIGHLLIIIALYGLSQMKWLKKQSLWIKLIPLSLIIGILGSIIINIIPSKIDHNSFSIIAFHIFNLSVISMGLTKSDIKGKNIKHRTIWGGIWMTAIFTAILCIQSLTGYGSVELYKLTTGNSFFEGYGLLSGHGFAQGSGHALSIGKIWESEYNLNGAISIGLTFSAIGYLIAVLIGIPFTKWLIMNKSNNEYIKRSDEFEMMGNQMKPNPIYKIQDFFFNLIIIAIIYIISIVIAFFLRDVVLRDLLKDFNLAQTLSNIILGLVFIIGLAIAILYRTFSDRLIIRSSLNNQIQKRYTSSLIDLLIISTFLSIEYSIISKVGIPIIIIIVSNIIITCIAFYLIRLKSNVNYVSERLAALFGTCFGSLANGLILLKILDPKINSPVYYELALMNFYSAFTLGHIMFIIFSIGEWGNISVIAGIYAVTIIMSLILARFSEAKLKD